MSIVLQRWHEKLGCSRYAALSTQAGLVMHMARPGRVDGWYAQYAEGLFAYWFDGERHFLHWRGRTVPLLPASSIEWSSGAFGLTFKVFCKGTAELSFGYHTVIREPWRLITDLVVPDDDWGLVFDLPSFIHSHYAAGSLPQLLAEWNARGDLAKTGVDAK
jgi:hypothetical protein